MAIGNDLVTLTGYASVMSGLDDLLEDWSGGQTWIVGTPAEYAIYVHEGTSRMRGRPFLTDAIDEVVKSKGDRMAKRANDGDELIMMLALELAGETKEKITQYDAVDSGNMRDGVGAVPL